MRWPEGAMPLAVYIAPFRWYEKAKQQDSMFYNQLVINCFQQWTTLTNGLVTFRFVPTINDSQIDIKWRRVDRKSLGHCEYTWNKQGALYSAEIQIGISDGVLHNQYNDPGEVKHTILHEIGHALGLVGHSDQPGDMMYVPHQYGITQLSARDVDTLRWLYKVPLGFDPVQTALSAGLKPPYDTNDVLAYLAGERGAESPAAPEPFSAVLHDVASQAPTVNLAEQADLLAQRGQFLMATSLIEVQLPPVLPHTSPYDKFNPRPQA
jgi:Matrixin